VNKFGAAGTFFTGRKKQANDNKMAAKASKGDKMSKKYYA